jgi:hypothetical protein
MMATPWPGSFRPSSNSLATPLSGFTPMPATAATMRHASTLQNKAKASPHRTNRPRERRGFAVEPVIGHLPSRLIRRDENILLQSVGLLLADIFAALVVELRRQSSPPYSATPPICARQHSVSAVLSSSFVPVLRLIGTLTGELDSRFGRLQGAENERSVAVYYLCVHATG